MSLDILQQITPQITNFVSIYMLKHINTGDRLMDTTIQVILTTLFGAFIAFLVALLTQEGRLTEMLNQWRCLCSRKTYNPLEFNPAVVRQKPRNGVCYLYQSRLITPIFLSWFHLHHGNKRYIQKVPQPIQCLVKKDKEYILDETNFDDFYAENTDLNQDFFPIWRHHNGFVVYVKGNGDRGYYFYSDCGEAMRFAVDHLNAHWDAMKQHTTKTEGGKLRIYAERSDGRIKPIGDVNVAKTFDKLFFSQKDTILPTLLAFKEKRMFPKHMPMENKLGLLLHGPPGTGKTGFLSALANYLQRNIILVDVQRLKTKKDLDEVFRGVEVDKSIFVFEEFDCMEGVVSRTIKPKEAVAEVKENPMAFAMMMMADKEKSSEMMEDYKREKKQKDDSLNLAYLLTKLDGLESGEGRCIVATTNHPELIDPALLRPGRFGIHLNLSKATHQMLVDILGMTYQLSDVAKATLATAIGTIEENKWSPCELIQLSVLKPSLEECLEHLRTAQPTM